ncbi:hypothetical protein Taro_028838 [Colocasia esculenta]|uniref:Uncharacterized protein n=1 Tax=Colocasia esculenta TaxID=4460 RepID=A0A843VPC1_COLES|nr:hypothetical protein [Colocasia esculenta]
MKLHHMTLQIPIVMKRRTGLYEEGSHVVCEQWKLSWERSRNYPILWRDWCSCVLGSEFAQLPIFIYPYHSIPLDRKKALNFYVSRESNSKPPTSGQEFSIDRAGALLQEIFSSNLFEVPESHLSRHLPLIQIRSQFELQFREVGGVRSMNR